MIENVIIIGSGPAGLTAGIYTARSKFNTILFEGSLPGGQLTTTTKVENWPGIIEVMGPQLMADMKKHAMHCGCKIISDEIVKVDFSSKPYKIFSKSGKEFLTNSVIVATGASYKKLNIPGEQEYWAKGVSVCATCDAPFFQDKEVVVIGGGNSAVMEAEHLSKYAKKVNLIHILDKLTATDPIKDKVLENPKIEIFYNSTATKIDGDGNKVTQIIVENKKDKKTSILKVDGVFIAIGLSPNTKIFDGQLKIDKFGYIERTQKTMTNVDGVFAAGDVADFRYKQAITAAGEGCMAALDCQEYLEKE